MDSEILIALAVLTAVLLPLAHFGPARFSRPLRLGILALWLAGSALLLLGAHPYRSATIEPPIDYRPFEKTRENYASSDACRSCHPSQYESWHRSWHRTMTQVVTPSTVLGQFEGTTLRFRDQRYELGRQGDQFTVRFLDPERGWVERPIVMSTGSHHMQIYWFSMREGSAGLGMLPFAYLKEEGRWTPRDYVFIKEPPEDHLPLENYRWNSECLQCHSTNPRPLLHEHGVNTQVAEFGIACEACHGPGGPHVRANAADPLRRYDLHLASGPDDTIVQPERLPKERAVEVCGQCHGATAPDDWQAQTRIRLYGNSYIPGEVLEDSELSVLRAGPHAQAPRIQGLVDRWNLDLEHRFWSDGMVRVPREYNGLLESPCYQRGEMTCSSCHSMHKPADDPRPFEAWAEDQLKPGMRGNAACLGCHPRFEADLEAHTRHAAESEGSRCQNCHTPYTGYALLKAIRQHEIDVPTVEATLETGRPNACNACHLDRSLGWTAAHLSEWSGDPPPELDASQREVSAAVLAMMTGDAAERALAAWHAGWPPAREASGGDWLAPHLAQLLEDPYPAVRYIAWRSLRSMQGYEDLEYSWDDPEGDAGRAGARHEAWRRWDANPPSPAGRSATLLLYPDGAIDRLSMASLLDRRDDRPVFVGE